MRVPPVLPLAARRRRRFERLSRERRRRFRAPPADGGGRAWINGREVGGTDPLFAELTRSYD